MDFLNIAKFVKWQILRKKISILDNTLGYKKVVASLLKQQALVTARASEQNDAYGDALSANSQP